jgi:hypothetical protein
MRSARALLAIAALTALVGLGCQGTEWPGPTLDGGTVTDGTATDVDVYVPNDVTLDVPGHPVEAAPDDGLAVDVVSKSSANP